MTPATAADIPAITAFLTARAAQAMFPLNNLALHGTAGGHPRAMRFWLAGDPITGVLGLTEAGMIMPNIPPDLVAAATRALGGRSVFGLVGPADCAVPLFHALGLHDRPVQMAHVEPHFLLDLSAMVMPETRGMVLTPIGDAPRALMLDWSVDYDVQTLGARPEAAVAQAGGVLDAWIAAGSHVVLWHDGQPVARTGFNAQCPGIVQIGGVYVPQPLRGRGYARAAVALHLAQAATQGVTRATLFSASDMAARAYQAIGFRQIGDWFLGLLDGTVTLPDG